MRRLRSRRALRLAGVLAVGCLSLLVFASAHGGSADGATASDSSAPCAPETATCAQAAFPCPGCTATAGPVTNIGSSEAVYVEVTGVPIGDELEVAYCSLAGGTQVVAQPQCASQEPPNQEDDETAVPEPQEYEYYAVSTNETVVSVPTEYDPDIVGGNPLISQTGDQAYGGDGMQAGTAGSFFCDNQNNPCGVEVMDIPATDLTFVNQAGVPPSPQYSAVGHTDIFPVTFGQGGSGCGSAPVMQVDASYSVEQFIPAAAAATCTGPGGVAALPTELYSVDDPGCTTGAGTTCPIEDVINANTPVTFTDDPEDAATLAELKAGGGKFAYIPIAVSATEIAFGGDAGSGSVVFGLSSYQLTPAQAAGIMTQFWNSATASGGNPNDDVCAELSGKAQCTETAQSLPTSLKVETANGKTDNLDVSQASGTTPQWGTFDQNVYGGNFTNAAPGGFVGANQKDYFGQTGYALLNPWPFSLGGAAIAEQTLGAIWPSTASGATFQTTGWMCDAPNLSYSVAFPYGGHASVNDIMSGQQILADAEFGPVPVGGNNQTKGNPPGVVDEQVRVPAKKCQALSTLPINFGSQGSKNTYLYQPSSSPANIATVIGKAVKFYKASGGFAFGAMDSSEADFFGLLPASLQNAAGAFVAPTAQSVNDALNDAVQNADGTLSPNFDDTSDTSAYPLPMVTYALVSTSPQPSQTQATQLKDLLTNLVNYDHNGGTLRHPPAGGLLPDVLQPLFPSHGRHLQ